MADGFGVSVFQGDFLFGTGFFGFEDQDGFVDVVKVYIIEGCEGSQAIEDSGVICLQVVLDVSFVGVCVVDVDSGLTVSESISFGFFSAEEFIDGHVKDGG